MGFEPVASAFALECSTSCAMKTHTPRASQVIFSGYFAITFNYF